MRNRSALFFLSLVPFALAGAAMASDYTGAPWKALTNEAELKKLVVDYSDLKDPHSAQFRKVQVRVAQMDGGKPPLVTWCGEVNAKNSMGGYTGFSPFYAVKGLGDEPTVTVVSDGSASGEIMMRLMCKGTPYGGE